MLDSMPCDFFNNVILTWDMLHLWIEALSIFATVQCPCLHGCYFSAASAILMSMCGTIWSSWHTMTNQPCEGDLVWIIILTYNFLAGIMSQVICFRVHNQHLGHLLQITIKCIKPQHFYISIKFTTHDNKRCTVPSHYLNWCSHTSYIYIYIYI